MSSLIEMLLPCIVGKVKHGSRWLIGLVLAASILVVGTTTTYTLVNRLNKKEDITQLTVGVQAKLISCTILNKVRETG